MTRVRSADSSMIDDRRGSGSGGGGFGGLPIPIKAGGGLLGIIVLLAALLLPRLLNGGQPATSIPQPQSKSGDVGDGTCSSDLEQIVCGATVDVESYWQANLPTLLRHRLRGDQDSLLHRCHEYRLRPGLVANGTVLLPGRSLGVHRSRVHAGARAATRRQVHRLGRAVHRRSRVRPSHPEPGGHQRSGAAGAAE